MNWNRKELYDLVVKRHGQPQADLLMPSLISTVWKLSIAQYHAHEAQTIIGKLSSHSSKDEYVEIVKLIFEQDAGSDRGREVTLAKFQAEAKIIACAQAVHSIADIFSQIIYLGLNLDKHLKKPILENNRYLMAVNQQLTNLPLFNKLQLKLNDFLTSKQFQYLSAYVNTTKHRSLIPSTYSISFAENIEPIHGLKISEFLYKGVLHKAKWSKEFFKDDINFFTTSFAGIGNEMNLCINLS
ncbi:MAG: hypothetical protein P8Z30_19760 [Acidobacteriota bacterium]